MDFTAMWRWKILSFRILTLHRKILNNLKLIYMAKFWAALPLCRMAYAHFTQSHETSRGVWASTTVYRFTPVRYLFSRLRLILQDFSVEIYINARNNTLLKASCYWQYCRNVTAVFCGACLCSGLCTRAGCQHAVFTFFLFFTKFLSYSRI